MLSPLQKWRLKYQPQLPQARFAMVLSMRAICLDTDRCYKDPIDSQKSIVRRVLRLDLLCGHPSTLEWILTACHREPMSYPKPLDVFMVS